MGPAERSNNFCVKDGANKTLKFHLAIVDSHTATLILEGKKLIETRFSQTKQAPFGQIRSGDTILIKKTGGSVVGTARASRIHFYSRLTSADIQALKEDYNDMIQADRDFWESKKNSKYATFVYLTDIRRTQEMRIQKSDRRGWVIYESLPALEEISSSKR